MTTATRRPVQSEYDQTKKAFRALWENKGVPHDLRLYMCGAVYNAGVRQGDEVYRREIFQKCLAGVPLERQDFIDMVEGVHKFVLVDNKLRLQYLKIVVHQIVQYLDKNMQHVVLQDRKERVNRRRGR